MKRCFAGWPTRIHAHGPVVTGNENAHKHTTGEKQKQYKKVLKNISCLRNSRALISRYTLKPTVAGDGSTLLCTRTARAHLYASGPRARYVRVDAKARAKPERVKTHVGAMVIVAKRVEKARRALKIAAEPTDSQSGAKKKNDTDTQCRNRAQITRTRTSTATQYRIVSSDWVYRNAGGLNK